MTLPAPELLAIRTCLADLYDSHTHQDEREKAVETLEKILFP